MARAAQAARVRNIDAYGMEDDTHNNQALKDGAEYIIQGEAEGTSIITSPISMPQGPITRSRAKRFNKH